MNVGEGTVLDKVCLPTPKARHITLIDPAKQDPEIAAQRAMIAVECGSSMVFVGGSTDTPDTVVHSTCKAIQEAFELRMFAASQDPTGMNRCGMCLLSSFRAGPTLFPQQPTPSRS
jgi:phosphoglycerol geranylgeranyltransferase